MMPCSVLTTLIPEEELAGGKKKKSVYLHLQIKRNHVDLWYIILHKISQSLAGNRACGCGFLHCVVLNFCLFSVKINDSPITLNSSFITAWYPGKRA